MDDDAYWIAHPALDPSQVESTVHGLLGSRAKQTVPAGWIDGGQSMLRPAQYVDVSHGPADAWHGELGTNVGAQVPSG